ncbi:MAG: HTTM domain-containing protein [Actinomycetota bacterium]|nr:HTTM domain-containing protein [Actinomycetota bacterium]
MERQRASAAHFSIFAFLFAAAVLFHQNRLSDWEVLSVHALLSLVALAVLLRPSSLPRFAALLVALFVDWAVHMPVVVNHIWAVAVFGAGVLVAAAIALARGRRWPLDGGELYERFAPVLRNCVVLVYLFAAVAKMNEGFLDSDVSCAVAMTDDLLDWLPFDATAGWQHSPAIWGTIAIELAIPALLFFRRTRLLGIAAGVPFHIVLALSGHVPFSGFAMAFYSLFLPPDFPERLVRLRERFPPLGRAAARIAGLARSPLAFPALALGWLVCALLVVDNARTEFDRGTTIAFVLYAAVLAGVAVLALLDGRPVVPRERAFRLPHPAWAVVPLLFAANAVSPYLGLKTQVSFTMYSNLQTEGDLWNHEVVPESVRVFGLQDDLVTIVSSSDERLTEASDSGTRFVWQDFRRRMLKNPDTRVTYERGGRRYAVLRAGDDPRLSEEESLAERKLLQFRDVPPPERNDCRSRRSAGADQGS